MPFGACRQRRAACSLPGDVVSEGGCLSPASAVILTEGGKDTAPAPGIRRRQYKEMRGDGSRASFGPRNVPGQVPASILRVRYLLDSGDRNIWDKDSGCAGPRQQSIGAT